MISRQRITRGQFLSCLLMIVAAVAACWASGFIWYIGVTHRPVEPPPHTDGIVALTGGAGRVELALRLLASGRADRLLLSGIGGGTDLATLGRLAGFDATRFADQSRWAATLRQPGATASKQRPGPSRTVSVR